MVQKRCESHRGWRSESHRPTRSESHRFWDDERAVFFFCKTKRLLEQIIGNSSRHSYLLLIQVSQVPNLPVLTDIFQRND